MKYKCVCGYIYDEAVEPKKFNDLPSDWRCPKCGAGKEAFTPCEPEHQACAPGSKDEHKAASCASARKSCRK